MLTESNETVLRARLAAGIVQFTFRKIDGKERPATGTTVLDLIPPAFRPTGVAKPRNTQTVTFFDLEKMAWRSCRSAEIISIDD